MNNPHIDKANAEREQLEAKVEQLKAQLKEAAADARITLQEQIDALERRLRGE